MPKFQDLTGQTFGLWKVVSHVKGSSAPTKWNCKCVCGTKKQVQAGHLKSGSSTCCGCDRGSKYDGLTNLYPDAYKSWRAMRARCLNQNHEDYKYYGGRGISISPRWDSFTNFLKDMGDRPLGKTLDRRDPNKNYCKSNCRWVTQKVQVRHLPQNQTGYKHKTRHGEARV
jgi:hypothetical protein